MTKSLIASLVAAALVAIAQTGMMGVVPVSGTGQVLAHEDGEVGEYELVVGFLHEPAYEGERNAVSIRVTKKSGEEQKEASGAQPQARPGGMGDGHHDPPSVAVEGLQDTLQVEVTHVPSNVSGTMDLRAAFSDTGHYVADLIPTSPGHYRFRFFGTIEGEAIDATFDSKAGGGSFDDVRVASAIHFPDAVASARELESAVRGLRSESDETHDEDDARDSAAAAMAIIGIALGAGGIAFGCVSLVLSIRNRKS